MPKDIEQLKKKQTKIREKADEREREINEYWGKKLIKAINFIKSQKGKGVSREDIMSNVFRFWDFFSSQEAKVFWTKHLIDALVTCPTINIKKIHLEGEGNYYYYDGDRDCSAERIAIELGRC